MRRMLWALVCLVAVVTPAEALNPEIRDLGDNRWVKLTLAPRTMRRCVAAQLEATDSSQVSPQSRVQNGIQVGVAQGRSMLFYFGGAHITHSCNDVELFDVEAGRWIQATFPEPTRVSVGTIKSATATTLTFTAVNATVTSDSDIRPPMTVCRMSGSTCAEQREVASYSHATRTVTLKTAWTTVPQAGASYIVYQMPGLHGGGVEGGGYTTVLTATGRPMVEHLQDYAKWDPAGERFIVLTHAGTMAFSPAAKTWTKIAGTEPMGNVSYNSLLHYDPDLAALPGRLGFIALNGTAPPWGKWTLTTEGWKVRGGFPSGLPSVQYRFLSSAYLPDLKRHLIQFSPIGGDGVPRFYLYDAVADAWEALPEVAAQVGSGSFDSLAYDVHNRRIVGIKHTNPIRAWVGNLTVKPSVWAPLDFGTQAIPRQPAALPSGLLRYDPVHRAFLFLWQGSGSGFTGGDTETWAYRLAVTAPPPPPPLAPTATLTAEPMTVAFSGTAALTWTSTGAETCMASGGWSGPRAPAGSEMSPTLTTETTFGLSCAGPGATATASVTVAVTPPPADDFARRCAAPGVVRCFSFDSQAETAPYLDAGASTPVVDTSIKASGAGSLKMTIPSNSGANTSGAFQMDFTPGSLPCRRTDCPGPYDVQFGEGEEFYVQWRQRFSPEVLTTPYRTTDGRTATPKLAIIGTGDRPGIPAFSCTPLEIVPYASEGTPAVPMFPKLYHSCGAKDGQYEGLLEVVPRPGFSTPDYRLQNAVRDNGRPLDPTLNCLYTAPGVPPCVSFKPKQWMTFQLHVKIGTWYRNTRTYRHDSTIELWVAEEGQPSRLVMRFDPTIDPSCAAANAGRSAPTCQTGWDLFNPGDGSKYGKVWLLPYMTGKDPTQAHPVGYVWYDDLIVSRNRIADPAVSPDPGPEPEPEPAPAPDPEPAPVLAPVLSGELSAAVVQVVRGRLTVSWPSLHKPATPILHYRVIKVVDGEEQAPVIVGEPADHGTASLVDVLDGQQDVDRCYVVVGVLEGRETPPAALCWRVPAHVSVQP